MAFQFTRPRGARPALGFMDAEGNVVSIHAPAWGATGAWQAGALQQCFNSRARVGRDLSGQQARATPTGSFNSRARVGRDEELRRVFHVTDLFQFTRPRGARRTMSSRAARAASQFQFTRPRGARRAFVAYPRRNSTFQFTRPRGARHKIVLEPSEPVEVSIHAPAWGATGSRPRTSATRSFNSRARVGRDRLRPPRVDDLSLFQFTRPRGARRAFERDLSGQ